MYEKSMCQVALGETSLRAAREGAEANVRLEGGPTVICATVAIFTLFTTTTNVHMVHIHTRQH